MNEYKDVPKNIGLAAGIHGPRIGFIFECQPAGPDSQIYSVFLEKLYAAGEITAHWFVPNCLGNKKDLVLNCGNAAKNLLAECDHVFICWDLYPTWQPKPIRPCLKADRDKIFENLTNANVPLESVTLMCISQELEAWLIADGNAFAAMARRDATPRIKHNNNPDAAPNVKANLAKRWQDELMRGKFNDWFHGKELAEASDLSRVATSVSFCRFVCKLRAIIAGANNGVCRCE